MWHINISWVYKLCINIIFIEYIWNVLNYYYLSLNEFFEFTTTRYWVIW